jgi:hypothetical protein
VGGWARTYRRKFPARCFHGQGTGRSKSNCFIYTNCHSNGYSYSHCYRDCYCNCNCDLHADVYAHGDSNPNTDIYSEA